VFHFEGTSKQNKTKNLMPLQTILFNYLYIA